MLRSALRRRNLGAGPCVWQPGKTEVRAQEQISYFAKLYKNTKTLLIVSTGR